MTSYITDCDAIAACIHQYTNGLRAGNSALAKPVFHEACTFFGYFQGQLLAGPVQLLFDWVDGNAGGRSRSPHHQHRHPREHRRGPGGGGEPLRQIRRYPGGTSPISSNSSRSMAAG